MAIHHKRFLLFAGACKHPVGGWGDFRGAYDTMEDAISVGDALDKDWYDVVDLRTHKIVATSEIIE
jgi:hypothetical protein